MQSIYTAVWSPSNGLCYKGIMYDVIKATATNQTFNRGMIISVQQHEMYKYGNQSIQHVLYTLHISSDCNS